MRNTARAMRTTRLPRALAAAACATALAATLATAQDPTGDPLAPSAVNPCQVPGNRLACPDLIMRKPTELSLRKLGNERLLLSTNAIINVGRGPLEILARRSGTRGIEIPARQAIHRRTGQDKLLREPDGEVYFAFVPGAGRGRYWKFEDAARFELYRLDDEGHRVALVRTGPKIFYCFRDLKRVRSYPRVPRRRVYPACSQRGPIRGVRLGTSVGWADTYPSTYPRNWIDVTGLRGCFAYVHIADPEQHLAEDHEDNNAAQRTVRLPWRGPGLRGCPHVRPGGPDVPGAVPPAPAR
jgi:hypothetical protein